MIDLEDLTIEDVEDAIGIYAYDWPGNCDAVAKGLLQSGLVNAHYRRGHWFGPVHPESHFKQMSGFTIQQHSWLETDDGIIIDPTRWCFTNPNQPFIYVGESDYYDTGSNMLRRAFRRPCPKFSPEELSANLIFTDNVAEYTIKELISVASDGPVPYITKNQAFWLANLSPEEYMGYTKEVYTALTDAGMRAAIPIDNYRMVME